MLHFLFSGYTVVHLYFTSKSAREGVSSDLESLFYVDQTACARHVCTTAAACQAK